MLHIAVWQVFLIAFEVVAIRRAIIRYRVNGALSRGRSERSRPRLHPHHVIGARYASSCDDTRVWSVGYFTKPMVGPQN
ncbi:hypothetical protein GALL_443250 [mine drainage metagenome]|uniref:Uncharacterized protein n=1 Tax=mine drainage metagenome TaxID=410659 RepID=A0A1J5PT81_9ZZZZ